MKTVYRFAMAGDHHESSAEHSWGALILADFFLSTMQLDASSNEGKSAVAIDRFKVYELIMYHDVVEIETGDLPIHPDLSHRNKKRNEHIAAKVLSEKLPTVLVQKYLTLFAEFQEQKTVESRFAKAVEALEADIHELDYKEDWKGWTEEFLRQEKEHLFNEFPLMKKCFDELVVYLKENGFFDFK